MIISLMLIFAFHCDSKDLEIWAEECKPVSWMQSLFLFKFKLKSIVQKTKVLARNKLEIGKMKTEAYLNFFIGISIGNVLK